MRTLQSKISLPRKSLSLLFATTLCGATSLWAANQDEVARLADPANPLDDPNTIIATVNDVQYPLDVFRVFYNERLQQSGGQNSPELQEQAFNEFLNLIVASQEGTALKLEKKREVQAALELQKMVILSTAALQTMAADVKPTDEELKTAYDQFVKQAKRTEYKARHILVDTEEKAKKLIKQLEKGKNFEELANEKSLGPTAEKGGDLGWFDLRQMVKPFADAVTQLKPGAYTIKPVQTQFGWHVILLEDTRMAEPPKFEDAKAQIEASVRRQKVVEKLGELRKAAQVKLNETVVKMKKPEDAEKASGDAVKTDK
ncbi:peptidylprolyl isomerase [Rhodopseudomonas palustris]|uniref:peptidylprolyl isomerase n=1 Tax=Thiospirillum jenense TaxID=1653858 RepID=A0A839HKM0_9GAMM|nr:peptidylprolyl isomerase [Thiospirillum jenense]MBB1093765.1 peptidylprolyl isomerase [Rhodopseudomonas palustris]MBB1127228.1 peptidylprolyl isomerase [Thiospirillum jenense]